MSGVMEGKRGLIMGLANDKSLAWGIAKQLAAQGVGHVSRVESDQSRIPDHPADSGVFMGHGLEDLQHVW